MFLIAVAFPLYVYITAWNFPESTVRFKIVLFVLGLISIASMAFAYFVWDGLNRRLGRGIAQFISRNWEPEEALEGSVEDL
jgi:hypothetical protein